MKISIYIVLFFVGFSCSAQNKVSVFQKEIFTVLENLSEGNLTIEKEGMEVYRLTVSQYGFIPFTIRVEKHKDSLDFQLISKSVSIDTKTKKKHNESYLKRNISFQENYRIWDTIEVAVRNINFWNKPKSTEANYSNELLPSNGIGGVVYFEGVKEGQYSYIVKSFLFEDNQVSKELEELCNLFISLRTLGVDKIYWDGSY